jgi:hypothetical protein
VLCVGMQADADYLIWERRKAWTNRAVCACSMEVTAPHFVTYHRNNILQPRRCKLVVTYDTPPVTMSSGTSGSDEHISATKIAPLASDQKAGLPHDMSSRGVTGTDRNIDQTRIDPIGGRGQYSGCSTISSLSSKVGKDGSNRAPLRTLAPRQTMGVVLFAVLRLPECVLVTCK